MSRFAMENIILIAIGLVLVLFSTALQYRTWTGGNPEFKMSCTKDGGSMVYLETSQHKYYNCYVVRNGLVVLHKEEVR